MPAKSNQTLFSLALGALLAWSPAAVRGAEPAGTKPLDAAGIERMAKDAKSPADHARVATQYELRGKSLEERADKIEGEVRQDKAAPSAMATKWPAMVVNARERREQSAMQARRAAEECYRLAQHHRTLAGDTRASE